MKKAELDFTESDETNIAFAEAIVLMAGDTAKRIGPRRLRA